MYTATEFIHGMVNELNPGSFDTHRYVIAKNSGHFYWLTTSDSRNFSLSNSEVARDITQLLYPPVDFCTRLLQKNVKNRVLSSMSFYTGKITGGEACSMVSCVYDLSGKEISDQVVAYLVYDHSKPELQETLAQTLDSQIPPELNVELVNLTNHENLYLSGGCTDQSRFMVRNFSEKYALHYSLSLGHFMMHDTHAGIVTLLTLFFFIMVSFLLKSWLNENNLEIYVDTLTGCFNCRVFDIIKRRDSSHCPVVLLDCSKFKAVNDTWGHAAGDRALQIIVNRILSNTRTNRDIVIRTGGDEFMILLFRSQTTDAIAIV